MRAIPTLTAILSVCVVTSALGHAPTSQRSGAESPDRTRVDALLRQSRQAAGDDATWEQVRDEIDALLSRAAGSDQSRQVEDRLRGLLAGHEPDPQYSRRPFVRVADLRHGRSIVAAYVILRGTHHDVPVIHGFVEGPADGFQLVAELTEFEGHGLFLEELPSPLDGEAWFIGWGRARGANGGTSRVRVFSFDGSQFRVVWIPPDMNDVTVSVTDAGFHLTHQSADVNPPAFVTDEYTLTPAGPDRLESTIHDGEPARRD